LNREASLVAEMPETRQHFFIFPDCLDFYPWLSACRTSWEAGEGASFS
jgi:hypothetical protein